MTPLIVKSKISHEGILHLSLSVGLESADQEVQVTVEALPSARAMSTEQWRTWVKSMAGTWEGEFERPPQGEYEEREALL